MLAKAIAEGIKEVLPTAEVECYDIIKHDMGKLSSMLNNSDAFLIGSPTLNRDALAPVWNLLAHVDAINTPKRPVALFGSYGWSGEAVANLEARLNGLKVMLFDKSFRVVLVPTKQDIENAKEFGKEFAQQL
jgi:flavorubredoxin